MRKLLNLNNKITTSITTLLFFLAATIAGPLQAADDAPDTDATQARVTQLSQADTEQAAADDESVLEEVVVVGTQIKGAAISEALADGVTRGGNRGDGYFLRPGVARLPA